MSYVLATPNALSAAAGNLGTIGSALRDAGAAAAAQTTAIAAPAADEISAAITALFTASAKEFQAVNAQMAAFHDEFVSLLNGGAAKYLSTEIANAQQTLANVANNPVQALLGKFLGGAAPAESIPPFPRHLTRR